MFARPPEGRYSQRVSAATDRPRTRELTIVLRALRSSGDGCWPARICEGYDGTTSVRDWALSNHCRAYSCSRRPLKGAVRFIHRDSGGNSGAIKEYEIGVIVTYVRGAAGGAVTWKKGPSPQYRCDQLPQGDAWATRKPCSTS